MRIAQIAPLVESAPPAAYGGTERVVAALCDELARRGHDVTLFASGDSNSSTLAELVPLVPCSLRSGPLRDYTPEHLLALTKAFARSAEFDVVHSHLDFLALPFGRFSETPVLHTLHGRLDLPEIQSLYDHYRDAALVSISQNQRRLVPDWNWVGTVYNGINLADHSLHPKPGSYLAFLGRISPEKGIEEAIEVARRVGRPLKIAAKIDAVDRAYFERQVAPLLADPLVEFVGEINDREKDAFLGHALALVFPVHWPEPFGLVMAEAMASGTPVVASRCVTGFLCDSVGEMVLACARVAGLDRAACRARATEHFSAARMADGYERIYSQLLRGRCAGPDVSAPTAVPHCREDEPRRNGAVLSRSE